MPHTVEEAYELADAVAAGDDAKIRDELGDVLFQVVFLSLLLEERGAGDLDAVAEEIIAKLIRRHPHVFAESEARELLADEGPQSSSEVLANWDRIKRDVEGRGADDPFADVPANLPALTYARKILRRAAPQAGKPFDAANRDADEREIGDALLELVAQARERGVDPELALRAAANRVRDEAR